jgi:hypothetical protein
VREHTSVSQTIYLPSAALNLLSQFIGSRSSCLWPIKYLPELSQSLLLKDAMSNKLFEVDLDAGNFAKWIHKLQSSNQHCIHSYTNNSLIGIQLKHVISELQFSVVFIFID